MGSCRDSQRLLPARRHPLRVHEEASEKPREEEAPRKKPRCTAGSSCDRISSCARVGTCISCRPDSYHHRGLFKTLFSRLFRGKKRTIGGPLSAASKTIFAPSECLCVVFRQRQQRNAANRKCLTFFFLAAPGSGGPGIPVFCPLRGPLRGLRATQRQRPSKSGMFDVFF